VSFLDDEETALQPAAPAPVRIRTSEEKQLDKLRSIEDRILAKSLAAVEDIVGAADIDDNHDDSIPQHWIAEVGLEAAAKRLRVARDARRNKKEAPVYLEHARATALGIIKARAAQPATISQLNVAFVVAVPPKARKAYPVIDVEVEEVGEK
jgi:hypothetical protein